ncbi:hypothetical protein CRG98_045685 [Punica granatum]|uniref:PPM-type phosphatase domain-containing protein n=2 Tax=Punica granatum TaxID=22663 RepID=A0A2I0HQD2_PUNGR|nr:hypothetical protein CRG98_045685 [Punica granatum]
MTKFEADYQVSFGYNCGDYNAAGLTGVSKGVNIPWKNSKIQRTSSFSCLSGAALSANATLANTNILNGLIGEEILPVWDSPNSFRRVPSSPTLSKLDMLSSSLQSSISNLSCSPSYHSDSLVNDSYSFKPMSAPSRSEGFLGAMELQVAGGAAGEDRVQAVCSEENGSLFCAIYDGFNGRDAADFLAGTFYDTITQNLNAGGPFPYILDGNNNEINRSEFDNMLEDSSHFQQGILDSLHRALNQAENDFLHMVEQEMDDRPDLVSVGSCVLVVLLQGNNLYTLNLGDSRAILATYGESDDIKGEKELIAVQLTDSHTVDNEIEKARVLCEHPDDPKTIVMGRVKGKLKVTRAFGVGYLKKENLNDALMGILRIRDLKSPPYISTEPSLNVHKISKDDHFVVVASDGLFDFFSNLEVVMLVHSCILNDPSADPAKFLLEQLVARAAKNAGFSMEELMNIPAGRRRKYHDDVTVMVIILGTNQRTLKASTWI